MSFPLRIEGTGENLGHVMLPALDEPASARCRVGVFAAGREPTPEMLLRLERAFEPRRQLLGGVSSPLTEAVAIALTDGGALAAAGDQGATASLPIQLLQDSALPIPPAAQTLLLEIAIDHLTLQLILPRATGSMSRVEGELGGRSGTRWSAYEHMLVHLTQLQEFLHRPAAEQAQILQATRATEVATSYSSLLERLMTVDGSELPITIVREAAAVVQVTSTPRPDPLDLSLLQRVGARFLGKRANDPAEVTRWVLDGNEAPRTFASKVWRKHVRPAQLLQSIFEEGQETGATPVELLQQVADSGALTTARSFVDRCRPGERIVDILPLLEDLLMEVTRMPQILTRLTEEVSRTAVQLLLSTEGAVGSVASRAEQLSELADDAGSPSFPLSGRFLLRFASEMDEDRRRQSARRADDLRAQQKAKAASMEAYGRFVQQLHLAGDDADKLEEVVRVELAQSDALQPEEARAAIDLLLEHLGDNAALAGHLMAQLMLLDSTQQASEALERALARRFDPLRDGDREVVPTTSTEVFEIFCRLLEFEGSSTALEDRKSAEELRGHAWRLLNAEAGLLKGKMPGAEPGQLEEADAIAASRELMNLRKRAAKRQERALAELADASFRFGLWASVSRAHSVAIDQFCELVRSVLASNLRAPLERIARGESQTADDFAKTNRLLADRELDCRRAAAAGAYLERVAARTERLLEEGRAPMQAEEDLAKILRALQIGEREVEGQVPAYQLLRAIPRVVQVGGQEVRVRHAMPPGKGGRAARIALLEHLFGDQPFRPFLGYRLVELVPENEERSRNFTSRLSPTPNVAAAYLRVAGSLFPDLAADLERRRSAARCQVFASLWVSDLAEFLERESPNDHQLIQPVRCRLLDGGEFQLLLSRHLPALRDDFPMTVHSPSADAMGAVHRLPAALVQRDAARRELRKEIADRLRREVGDADKSRDTEGDLVRLCAHSAIHALLLMNVEHRVLTADGKLVPLSYEQILGPIFDPELAFDPDAETTRPVSTRWDRRIDVACVQSEEEVMAGIEVGILYNLYLAERGNAVGDLARKAGFSDDEAKDIQALIQRNADRLMNDLAELASSGGCVYVLPNRAAADDATPGDRFGMILGRQVVVHAEEEHVHLHDEAESSRIAASEPRSHFDLHRAAKLSTPKLRELLQHLS